MRIVPATNQDILKIKRLYKSAFPRAERKPFWLILKKQKQGVSDIFVIEESGFAGFFITLKKDDLILIDYFAVSDKIRSRGIGSRALTIFCEKYNDKRIFLEIELPDENAANNVQRIKRKSFYLKNGFHPADIKIKIYGTDMELLYSGAPVCFEEYKNLLKFWFGRYISMFLKLKRISD